MREACVGVERLTQQNETFYIHCKVLIHSEWVWVGGDLIDF